MWIAKNDWRLFSLSEWGLSSFRNSLLDCRFDFFRRFERLLGAQEVTDEKDREISALRVEVKALGESNGELKAPYFLDSLKLETSIFDVDYGGCPKLMGLSSRETKSCCAETGTSCHESFASVSLTMGRNAELDALVQDLKSGPQTPTRV